MAVIAVESAINYSFVKKDVETRRKGQYKAELTLSPRLYVKPLITAITVIAMTNSETKFLHITNLPEIHLN